MHGWTHVLWEMAVPSLPSLPPSTVGMVLDIPLICSFGKLASALGVHTQALQLGLSHVGLEAFLMHRSTVQSQAHNYGHTCSWPRSGVQLHIAQGTSLAS